MKCLQIFREGNEFYLQLESGRWWNADRNSIRPLLYGCETKCTPTCSPVSPISEDEKGPPYRSWHLCSRLDYITMFGRNLEKDLLLIEKLIEEAWRSGRIASKCLFRDGKVLLTWREPGHGGPSECNKTPLPLLLFRNRDEVTLELPY